MEPTGLLTSEHPSYTTESAAFMFAVSAGSVRKFIIVEAVNRMAVHTVERILGPGQAVSSTCKCMAIFRDLGSLGTRDDMLEEVPYVDFMLDIVPQDKLMDDPLAVEGFNKSLSEAEREYVQRKIEAEEDRPPPSVSEARTVHAKALPAGPSEEEQIVRTLQGYGFRPQMVKQFVESVRHKIGRVDAKSLVREGCKALAA